MGFTQAHEKCAMKKDEDGEKWRVRDNNFIEEEVYKALSQKQLDESQWTSGYIYSLYNKGTNTLVMGGLGWKRWFVRRGCKNKCH